MKTNLLPKMEAMAVIDRHGNEAAIDVKVLRYRGKMHVFMSDRNRFSASAIARNTGQYLSQLVQSLGLDVAATVFFRHIYSAETGSIFGRFSIEWDSNGLDSYTFSILSNIDQAVEVRPVLTGGETVPIGVDLLYSLPEVV